MAKETTQIETEYSSINDIYTVRTNSHNDCFTHEEITTQNKEEARDFFDQAIKELARKMQEGYKESGWWKQVERDGRDVTDSKSYGVKGIPGLGIGDIQFVASLGQDIKQVGTNKIKVGDDVFQHMKAHEVKTYNSHLD